LTMFQLDTLNLHICDLTKGRDFASQWQVESGDARLFKDSAKTLLSYHFDSPASAPIVLRYDGHLPPGVTFSDIHRLTLATGADNSWNRVTASLDIAGDHWVADDSAYIAQFRPLSFIFQPPTYDDQTLRAKNWISLKKAGPAPLTASIAGQGVPAIFRIVISPSSTFRANWGKFWRNYYLAVQSVPFLHYIFNSLLLVLLSTTGALFSASFVAYAFARLHWPGRSVAFMLLLSTMMLPGQVTMIPGFMVWRAVHWYNTLNPLWVPAFFGSAFFIFLMTQHMRTIPKDLEEAARIDGLNAVQSWYYVILPQVTPTLAAIAILSFMGAWNDFMGPLIYLRDQTLFPLSLGLYGIGLMRQGGQFSWSVVMAGDIMMTVPVIMVFFIFQRYFVQGMTLTGMKG
jgi:multiple sugar transport system permease protein